MIYDYYGYYQSPMTQFMDMGFFLAGAAVLAIVAGVVLFATFMNKKHEGKHQGFWQRVYNFLIDFMRRISCASCISLQFACWFLLVSR